MTDLYKLARSRYPDTMNKIAPEETIVKKSEPKPLRMHRPRDCGYFVIPGRSMNRYFEKGMGSEQVIHMGKKLVIRSGVILGINDGQLGVYIPTKQEITPIAESLQKQGLVEGFVYSD